MASKLNTVGKLVYRNLTLCSYLNGKNQQRYKKMNTTAPVKSSRAVDLKGEKNRSTWEKLNEEEQLLKGKFCSDDVYFANEYEKIKYSLDDAISFHQECCLDKSMLDSPNAVLKANFLLNMRTKKATKFLQKLDGVVIPTNELTFLPKPKIVVFCTTPEDIQTALAHGAYEAGDETLVKKLEQGQIFYEEFDQVVCHTDAAPVISKLKSILRDKLPTKQNQRISDDIKAIVETYVKGYEFESKKIEGIPEEAHLTMPLGEINWPVEKLKENFLEFLKKIVENSSVQALGDPISKVTLVCPPSDEVFLVDFTEDMAKFLALRPKKHVKSVEET